MKYCSKCGNELLDEAVVCPKCGCAVGTMPNESDQAEKILKADKKSKITSAKVLNVIAFVVAILTFFVLLVSGQSPREIDLSSVGVNITPNSERVVETMAQQSDAYLFAKTKEEKDAIIEQTLLQMAVVLAPEIGKEALSSEEVIGELEDQITKYMKARVAANNTPFVFLMFSIVLLVLGMIAARQIKKGKRTLTYIYMILAVGTPICTFIMCPEFIALLFCGIGLILFVPTILQLRAGTKLLKAAAISE